jgi:hypothetical protein
MAAKLMVVVTGAFSTLWIDESMARGRDHFMECYTQSSLW